MGVADDMEEGESTVDDKFDFGDLGRCLRSSAQPTLPLGKYPNSCGRWLPEEREYAANVATAWGS
jgi:hypothetical protein